MVALWLSVGEAQRMKDGQLYWPMPWRRDMDIRYLAMIQQLSQQSWGKTLANLFGSFFFLNELRNYVVRNVDNELTWSWWLQFLKTIASWIPLIAWQGGTLFQTPGSGAVCLTPGYQTHVTPLMFLQGQSMWLCMDPWKKLVVKNSSGSNASINAWLHSLKLTAKAPENGWLEY